MGMTERYLSQIGTYTGDQMKNALYQLLIPRYFWTLWNSESAQKLASSVVNFLFCEPGSGEIARFMAEQQPLIESKARELATDEAVCRALTCAVYNFSYGRYVDSGGTVGIFSAPFLGFIRAIQEVTSGRERASFLESFIAKVGSRGAQPVLRLLDCGLYRPLPHTPDSKLMRDEVARLIDRTEPERATNLDALEVVEVSGLIAAAIVAFSSEKKFTTSDKTPFAFEDTVAMLQAGFVPREISLEARMVPSATQFGADDLFPAAFRSAVAFICFYVHNVVGRKIKHSEDPYCNKLHSCVARLCAGRFGFPPNPATTFETIQLLIPPFFDKPWINVDSVGQNDCLAQILNDLSVSGGDSNRYGFVVGSKKQVLGCASPFMGILMRSEEVFSRVESVT